MNIKKLSYFKYCMRTFILSVPIGTVVGYNIAHADIFTAVIIPATVGIFAAVAVSSLNYKMFVMPMKRSLITLERLAIKSGAGASEDLRTIPGLEKTFLVILRDLSRRLDIIAAGLTGIVEDLGGYMGQAIKGAEESSGTIKKLSESASEISGKVEDIGKKAGRVVKVLDESARQLHLVGERIKVMAGQNEMTIEIVKKFYQYSDEISKALETISGIAQRINLLSLNASIEAAKAGDSERDFAVVAAEVGKLADQSVKVVGEIKGIVEEVSKSSHLAWESVNVESGMVRDGAEKIHELERGMDDLLSYLKTFVGKVNEIPEAVYEIAGSVQNISTVALQTTDSSRKMGKILDVVANRVANLNSLSRKFKIDVQAVEYKGKKPLDIKNLKPNLYLLQTALIALPYFGFLGLCGYFLQPLGAVFITTFAGILSGAGGFYISSVKYRQTVGPMKGVMSKLESVSRQSGIESTGELNTVDDLEKAFASIIGDLTSQLEELGEEISETVLNLKSFADQTMAGAEETASSAAMVASNTMNISSRLESINEFVNNMLGSLDRGSRNFKLISQLINSVAGQSKKSVDIINQLHMQSGGIVKSLELVTDIAQRTNLLSQNAAIKAIKAGDAGRGFTVVAGEVGKLAEQSGRAAREIGDIVNKIADCSGQAMSVINEEYQIVLDEAEKINNMEKMMAESLSYIGGFFRQTGEIPTVVCEISAGVQSISAVAQEYNATTQEVNNIVCGLEEQVEDLRLLARKYSLD
ncbi:MAG: methyl-accepting chemotaxis protein [Bacillota bacterium]